ncbi:hypothetical protein EDE08_109235 [Bradyrhizobium sp. R2.2-H]|jgi:hypothetical protein|uniref:hypothetical protein n=1 Tax=unclassified Bradyrhizobium TaxID=2631580 RepID=UPI00104FBC1C|nr:MULTISPECIES: hypothetical protein [unclassified Bradyrhizobium]TCU68364.1 hypothetical protein EDE10_109178 [Bradyrhizobium sp. Y-H1]TCU70014.1 hypothetical protein EDE08_109235 [Bradyrhizobium sp. R2.2-H]
MARSSARGSIKTTIMILVLATLPALSFAQTTGGSAGSSGSSVGPTGGSVGSTGGSVGSTGGFANSPVPPPGLNSLGTAQSSGPGSGVTTGIGGGEATDAAVNAENRQLDRKIKSICRGC